MARPMICTRCYSQGKPRKNIRGTFLLEASLWLGTVIIFLALSWAIGFLFGLIALTYSLWRLTGSNKSCASCGAPELVPADSPRGRQIAVETAIARPATKTEIIATGMFPLQRLSMWEWAALGISVGVFGGAILYGYLSR